MPWTKEDRSFKTLINRRTTSSSKAYYEESGDLTINAHIEEIWVQSISSTPSQAVSDGVAEQKTLFTLTEDTSVESQQCYYAQLSGTRLKDWISEKYGIDYRVHLYQNNGTEIFPTDPSGWFFDYQTGILTFSGSTASFAKPFKISGYRYIGLKGNSNVNAITRVDLITATSEGQTVFYLTNPPTDSSSVLMIPEGGTNFINGYDFSVNDRTVTYLATTPSINSGDRFSFIYQS